MSCSNGLDAPPPYLYHIFRIIAPLLSLNVFTKSLLLLFFVIYLISFGWILSFGQLFLCYSRKEGKTIPEHTLFSTTLSLWLFGHLCLAIFFAAPVVVYFVGWSILCTCVRLCSRTSLPNHFSISFGRIFAIRQLFIPSLFDAVLVFLLSL